MAAIALLLAGCGGGGEPSSTSASSTTSTQAEQSTTTTEGGGEATTPSGGEAAPPAGTVQLYFTAGEQFQKVDRKLPGGGSDLLAATEALVDGPVEADRTKGVEPQTAIPGGVAVEDVSLAADGAATVELSARFMAGIPVEPAQRDREQRAELAARLGQVTYTLTQFDGVEAAKVVAGGEAVVPDEAEPAVERADFAKPSGGANWKAKPRGAKSLGTREVQQRLADMQYLPRSAVDGVDGYRTQEAVIAFQAWNGLDRDGVVGPATTAALAKANAPQPSGQGPSRRVEVYRAKGVALLVAHDATKRAIHVSSGGPGTETPAGTFSVFRKELMSWSVPFQVWLPFASYFNNGIAFHEYPDVPAYPASHGCVRVPSPEAKGLYKFAKLGTAVIVF
jgi:lipoprotein-anchoring transpeptidase ErfK/SrfK